MGHWTKAREGRAERIDGAKSLAQGKVVAADDATRLLEALIRPGDRVCLEGDN